MIDAYSAAMVVRILPLTARLVCARGGRYSCETLRWTATTRKIYADEQPRLRRSHREFAEAVRRGR
ncbi:MAG: hypothetical protein ACRDS9_19105 [Pseudonocardiaceae bacterium]